VNNTKKALVELHIGIVFMSAAVVFAKTIQWHATVIIFWRMVVAAAVLSVFIYSTGKAVTLRSKKDTYTMVLLGMCLAGHWALYFLATQVSTVAIALISVNTHALLTSLLEPWYVKESHAPLDVIAACIALIGIAIMIDDWSLTGSSLLGIILGLTSALCMAVRNILSRSQVRAYSGTVVMWYQLLFGAVLLSPFVFMFPVTPTGNEVAQLLLLATIVTAFAHTLALGSMKNLSAKTAGMSYLLVPVYGVIIAAVAIQELPTPRVCIGGAIVLSTLTVFTLYKSKTHKT
jgi:drug/metabolite transporter (DMT)-like permease